MTYRWFRCCVTTDFSSCSSSRMKERCSRTFPDPRHYSLCNSWYQLIPYPVIFYYKSCKTGPAAAANSCKNATVARAIVPVLSLCAAALSHERPAASAAEAVKITVSEPRQSSGTNQRNTQTNGNCWGWRQRGRAALHGVSLVREKVCLVPSDI